MLEGFKRLFATGAPPSPELPGVEAWAASRHYGLRVVGSDGFVIDGKLGGTPWRLEWGPSQRPYIEGHELRLRAELGLSPELQVLLMNRALAEQMEKAVFEQYVEGVQTRIDNQTPPEMRWLVMFPKLAGTELGPLREQFIALASIESWLRGWLQGALTQSLARTAAALRADPSLPWVLMIGRGRLMLRTPLAEAAVEPLQGWLRLFEVAIHEARRAAGESGEGGPSTAAGSWATSALPGDERK